MIELRPTGGKGTGMDGHYCKAPECLSLARKAGWCWAHYKRQRKGQPVHEPLRAPLGSWDAMIDAFLAYVDAPAEDDREYRRAAMRVRRAVRAWRDGSGA